MSGALRTHVLARVDTAAVLDPARRAAVRALWKTGRVDALLLSRSGPHTADPTVAAAFLAATHPGIGLVIDADVTHDFPYNLARRIASLQALDERAPGVVLPAGAGAAILPLHLLWQSWPRDSILGDRRTRTFVDVSRLRRVDAGGRYPVAGPLQTPVDQTDLPVVLQHVGDSSDPSPEADVLVTDAAHARHAGAVAAGRPVFVETNADGFGATLAGGPDGIIVSGAPEEIADELSDLAPADPGGLRVSWRLQPPRPVLRGEPAFAATGPAGA